MYAARSYRVLKYWIEFLNGEDYVIKGSFASIGEVRSQVARMIFTKHWLISQTCNEAYKVIEWSSGNGKD